MIDVGLAATKSPVFSKNSEGVGRTPLTVRLGANFPLVA